jgi:Flp pilus assembly protein TadG
MHIGSLFARLHTQFRQFSKSERGNVLITFAVAALPMFTLVGAAVDYSRGASARAAMQAAIDSTGLFLSKEAQNMNPDDLQKKASEVFTALLNRSEIKNVVVTSALTNPTESSYRLVLDVTATVSTVFAKFVGAETMNLGANTEVEWGVRRLELALALDVTGSMASNNKMTELKKAAKSLLTTLKGAAKKNGDIRVAIVPFAVTVNAGASVAATSLDWSRWMNKSADGVVPDGPAIMATWLQTQANQNAWDRAGPGRRCPFTTDNHGFACTDGPAHKQNSSTVTNIPSNGTYSGLICPGRDNGGESTTATGLLANSYHNGCYTSVVRPNSDWYPVDTGSGASCGGLPSSQCQCSGSDSNRVCAFHPKSNWQPYAKGSGQSCGNLPSSACECFGSGSDKVCKQKAYDHEWRPRPKTAWNGCVRDRNQNFDTQNTAPSFGWTNTTKTNIDGQSEDYASATTPATADAVQPFQHENCPAALLPLTFEWTTLENKIDELQPSGNTNVTIGLAWAFHALTPSAPLGTASAPADDLDKVIILLTDGDNTQNRFSNSQSAIDARTTMACANVKAANIRLYTIRVIDGNASLLQACASKPDMFYNVQNASELNDVFTTIAQSLANLRIAK